MVRLKLHTTHNRTNTDTESRKGEGRLETGGRLLNGKDDHFGGKLDRARVSGGLHCH